jgi:hypothetical protein
MTDPKPPDLQELVEHHGGYDKITPEAWEEYDLAIEKSKIDRLLAMGLQPISPAEMKERKRRK